MTKPILAMISGFVLAFGMFVGGLLFALIFMVPGEPGHGPTQMADASGLWTAVPRRVDAAQNLDRVAPRPDAATGETGVTTAALVDEPGVDMTETASISTDANSVVDPADETGVATLTETRDPAATRLMQAHVDWCSRRYRSYQPADNTYMPYAGGQRACFSPYSAELAALTGAPVEADPHVRFVPREYVAPEVVRPPRDLRPRERRVIEASADDAFASDEIEIREVRRRPILDRLFGERRIVAKDCSHYRTYDPADNTYQPYGGGPRRVCG